MPRRLTFTNRRSSAVERDRRATETSAERESRQAGERIRWRARHDAFRTAAVVSAARNFASDADTTEFALGAMSLKCPHRQALLFAKEKRSSQCCHQGKVQLPLQSVPRDLQTFIMNNDAATRNYLEHIRQYNNAFAFASFGAKIDPPPGHGPYCFRIHGQIYHRVAGLEALPGRSAKYASLYFLDSEEALRQRNEQPENRGCEAQTMLLLHGMLEDCDPYAHLFHHMSELCHPSNATEMQAKDLSVTFLRDGTNDRRRYNDPRAGEVAAVFVGPDGEPPANVDVRVYSRNQPPTSMPTISRHCEPMTYPLLFPRGEFGWHPDMTHQEEQRTSTRIKVTQLQFYAYRLAVRGGFSLLHSSGKLFQQYVVDAYVKTEGNRLNFIRQNQRQLRVESYSGLLDYIHSAAEDRNVSAGRMMILPSSFIGSPRSMQQNYQDAMAIIRVYGKPDLFITFTCNPRWREILDCLQLWEKAESRPDLVARVFHLKLEELLNDLTKRNVFGKVVAYVYTVEFQKRGLPHAHILLVLDGESKIRDREQIDRVVCAELPDEETSPRLFQIIKSAMIHGPCGSVNLRSPCMEDGQCSKGFPKPYTDGTRENVNGYPVYRRRDDGRHVMVGNVPATNQWVVPYNPYLSCKFNAHINVEVCSSIKSVKYVFKYVYKGHDCANIQIRQNFEREEEGILMWDEITTFLDARYVSPPEAVWRLHERDMHRQSHSIVRLAVHEKGFQSVTFPAGSEEAAIARAECGETTLTAYFKLNQSSELARQHFYTEIPEYFVWDKASRKWKVRQRGGAEMIGRMYMVPPSDRERFFLRMLLLHVKGATSFEDLRTVDGVIHDKHVQAAKALRLMDDDNEWEACMREAVASRMPPALRDMFAYILALCVPTDPTRLWQMFQEDLIEDYRLQYSADDATNRALWDIQGIVRQHNTNCFDVGLDTPTRPADANDDSQFDIVAEAADGETLRNTLNDEQASILEDVLRAMNGVSSRKQFFIDGPGGTGKTYLYRCLLHLVRGQGRTGVPVAWTGIAANLLKGGRTSHSAFKLPLLLDEASVSSMKPNSMEGRRLRDSAVIIWDEAPMAPKHAIETFERLLRDLTNCSRPFGGKLVVFGGDFRQVLPVKRRGTRTQMVELSFEHSPLWAHIVVKKLRLNMRTGPEEKRFSDWLLKLGEGRLPEVPGTPPGTVRIPDESVFDGTVQELVTDTYGDTIATANAADLAERGILAPKNDNCDEVNDHIVHERLPGVGKDYFSVDGVEIQDPLERENYPTEFLNKLTPSGLPPHKLFLKVGAVVMLIRNLNGKLGLMNGTRMIIRQMYNNYLDVEVITGERAGQRVLIPRIILTTSDPTLPFVLKRKQFPLRLAYAMTINKAQGQTLRRVGLYLPDAVFAHGQLYVAFSRVSSIFAIKVKVVPTGKQGKLRDSDGTFTVNVVYPEVLS